MSAIRVTVPIEVAEALQGVAGVSPASPRRSTWEIVMSVWTGATTVLTILQVPSTVADVSDRIHKLLPKSGSSTDDSATISAKGPGGELTLTVTGDVDIEAITRLLTETLCPEDETS